MTSLSLLRITKFITIFSILSITSAGKEGIEYGSSIFYYRCPVSMCRDSGRRLRRSRTEEPPEPRDAFCFRGGGALSDVSCLCAHGGCLGADEVAIFARYHGRMVVYHRNSPLLRQPLSAESEWCALAWRGHAPGRISFSGWLGLLSVGSLEGMSEAPESCSSRRKRKRTTKENSHCEGPSLLLKINFSPKQSFG